MFLSDELYEIGSSVNMENPCNIILTIQKMIEACDREWRKQQDLLKLKPKDLKADIAVFDRINLTWKLTVDKLIKEDKNFVKKDGYEYFIKSGYPDLYEIVFGNKREELNRELNKK
jgi:hypothetical protein